MTDREWMLRACALAEKGSGFVNPNPQVGCVIVRDGAVIGEGYHERYGALHAERNALKHCTEDPRGATMYVTLEPCCHYGKNPPCTEAVIAAGIRRVVVGSDDPNPLVAGKGLRQLREAGIAVETGVCKAECDRLNRIFFHYITTRTPYCILKTAMTADGKTATRTGSSKWITGEAARNHVHETRKRVAAILCGIGTVLADDPMLNCRLPEPHNPVRVVCDSRLRIPMTSRLVQTAGEIPTVVAACAADAEKQAMLEQAGVQVLLLPEEDGHVSLRALMRELGSMQLDSVLIEGGAELHEAALRAGIVQQVQVYLAPKIFGGKDAKPAVGGLGAETAADAYQLSAPEITRFGDDVLLDFMVKGASKCSPES
ncbi:MAG: bifunctional diaminohydroxyphosphoribosylaminopyrimidine deaminase/5-amino-6-(5-phosphoribosylamino)uracil reductase RibD [Oscillospiraceae bacterium]|nr:bifunctional diaminohydroxyphosphoribosylaminopyrimidine deaminase/5-amino-6-(5-phosphoribosylamino)uracil reductase RibD [Oscillospiraceae bacterium]